MPLILAGGFWPPLAVAIAGDVGGTTILALFFIPAAYSWLSRKGWVGESQQPKRVYQVPLEAAA